MAKIVLTISANNKATQSVKLLNAEVQTLSKTLSSIKVNKNLTTQINALTKHYTALAKAAVRVNEATTKRQIAEQRLANEVKRGRTEDQRTLKVKAQKEQAELRLKQAQDKATQSTQKQTTATKQNTAVNKEHRQSILSMTRGILEWQIATTLVMKPLRALQDALASINETLVKTEDSVIALQRVLPSGSATDGEISSRLYKIAQDYGQTFDNVSQIAENFARTGMSWADTIKATEAAVLALNVAELDAEEATNGLIAILSQFDMSTAQLTETVDKLNKAADNNPVTTEKLLKALQRTGSAAKNANINLDDTIGIITTLSKATNRSGENLGTAVNSLIQFSSKASSLKVFKELGGDVATAVEKYQAGAGSILEIWEKLGAVIKDRQGNAESILGGGLFSDEDWAGLNEELKEALGESYADVTDIYDTASTFRKNYFIALLNDMENVKKVSDEIANAQGYSQDENKKYLDTYTAKLNSLQAKWQDIANDEQGLLGIKKDLLDMGSGVLDIIKYAGGLKTVLIALGVIVSTIVLSFKGEAIIATLTKLGTLLKSMTIDAIPNAIGAWKSFAKGISSAGTALQASLPLITAVIVAISALDSAIRRGIEEREERERKAIEQQNEAIAKTNESIDTQKKEVSQMNEVASTVENLRKILDDSSKSEEEKAKAQDKLLQIQNTLVDRNNAYKDSLDLTNGSLKEQLGLIEQLTTEQLKQKANDFLSGNEAEIEIAKNRLDSTSTTNTDMLFSSSGWLNSFDFRDVINKAISGAGIGDTTSINEDNTYTVFDNYGKRVGEGFKNGFWDGVGELLGLGTVFDSASYVGESNAGFSFSGTIEQQLEAIEKLKTYIATNKDTLGLTAEQVVSITTELRNKYNELNSEEYKQAQLLAEKAKATQDWLDGTIDEAEYLKIVYGIEKDITSESDKWTNNIQDVKGKYDDLISKLEELRDLQKESTEWEEKKLAVMEAEQALENAKNEATVRRFNQATGQWEWQTDEKKIAEAEENLQKAQLNLQEAAYNNIIEQLKEQTATNDSILAILKEVAPLLGEDFSNAVQNAIKDKTGVDITKPAISNFDAAQNYINEKGLKESDREKWTEDKTFEKLFNALTDEEKSKLKGKSYDSGGVANGLGFMAKATAQPETVNDPELTKKILSPVSNAEFNRYVRDMGIMFERSHQYAQAPIIERVGGAVDNRVNNSGQVIMNGVAIGSDKRGNSLDEILSLANIVPNV